MRSVVKRLCVLLVLASLSSGAMAEEGTLTPDLIKTIRENFQMDAQTRAIRNALTSTSSELRGK